MADTQLRKTLEDWSPASKAEFRADLENVTKIPPEGLRRVVQEVARTYPACNIREVIAREAERSSMADPQELFDVMSGLTFLWANSGHETPQAVAQDLVSLEMASDAAAKIVEELLTSTLPLREGARAVSAYLRVGAPLFVSIKGVVDIRCRFHEKEEGLNSGAVPTRLIDTHPVVMASLLLNDEDDDEKTVSFLMDENDLGYLKRFVRNMEKELELSKRFFDTRSAKTNG
jgi:hypothetical protein